MKPQKRLRSSMVDIVLDRLSEMPDQVLVHILSLMPTRDAIRTVLIRRFGYLWTMVHSLSFDFNEHYPRPVYDDVDDDDAYDEERRLMSAAFSRFARFVRNVLMFHRRSTIDSFCLDIGEYKSDHVDPCLIDDVHLWLKFATDREVKHLAFCCDSLDELALPRCIFTSQSLVTLTIFGSLFEMHEHQPQFHMGALRVLILVRVQGSNEAFKQLISACPSLEELEIYNAVGLRDLNITAPSATRLDLTIADVRDDGPFTLNCPHVEILDIRVSECSQSFLLDAIDVSSLQVVNVGRLPKCLSGLIIKPFLWHFRDAKVLTLSSQAFEQLCCVEKVDVPQNKWKSLALQPLWDNEKCLQVIIELVKSSVDLEELIIYAGQSSASEGNHEVLGSKLSTTCEMPLLKKVTIHGYGKYREENYEGPDRLSELPVEVIVHILSSLPIVDAVRTMLIRRFGNLWTLLPTLTFAVEEVLDKLISDGEWRSSDVRRFSIFVGNVLMLHKSPVIDKFYLRLGCYYEDERREAGDETVMWLRFALDKQAKEIYFCDVSYDLTNSSDFPKFTSQSLVTLELYEEFDDPWLLDFPYLKCLDLKIDRIPDVINVSSVRDVYLKELFFHMDDENKLKILKYFWRSSHVVKFSNYHVMLLRVSVWSTVFPPVELSEPCEMFKLKTVTLHGYVKPCEMFKTGDCSEPAWINSSRQAGFCHACVDLPTVFTKCQGTLSLSGTGMLAFLHHTPWGATSVVLERKNMRKELF
ncbi:hypothetical protein KSS87_013492 [Heliosperma pusillum]|nr:hypothetical protein KSS87_013492 [Heliosperma pusillum]